ncbi:MAG: protein kinase [Ignavibacteriae bacterium]|nr:protein kinase [Ignavibacteriota bacterium]
MKTINNYKITSQIAEGGMGVVYYGEHITLNRPVAIKQLNSNLTNNPQFRDRFVNEAMILAQLNHPNIITIYDLIEDNSDFYIVMEYIQGDTLDNIMKNMRSPFQLQRALNIFIQTLKAFDYAHSKGIVHRDIKPSNIILDENDTAKVLDFGIAKILQSDLNLTKAGTKMGSLYYMSPEQVTGNLVDTRSDIYALGIVLYELLTNSIPYNLKTDTEFEIMQAIVNQIPVSISSFRKDIPESISNVINKATQKAPNLRFATCKEFEKALNDSGFKFEEGSNSVNHNNSQPRPAQFDRTVYQAPQQSIGYNAPVIKKSNNSAIIISGIFALTIIAGLIIFFVFGNNSNDKVSVNNNTQTQNTQNSQSNSSQSNTQNDIKKTPPPKEERVRNPNIPGDYPEGSSKYLTYSDISNLSKYQIKIMKNEIYARHGYIFKVNPDMINHFNGQSWYEPKYYNVDNMLSDVERKNALFLKQYE